jgi:ABC-2 type transport system permease protein
VFRRFFTGVVPLACVSYYPVLAALGRVDPLGSPRWAQMLAPCAGVASIAVAVLVWRAAVRRYRSTGS